MSHQNHSSCGGVLAWEQVCGILVHVDGVYKARCIKCGGVKLSVRPRRGAKCHRLTPKAQPSRGPGIERRRT